ncbi:MAG: hypothetical protein ACLUJG_10715 [Lawsonibacter sp.]
MLALLARCCFLVLMPGRKPEDYPAAFRCPGSLYMTLSDGGEPAPAGRRGAGHPWALFRAFQLWRDGLGQETAPVMELLAAVLLHPLRCGADDPGAGPLPGERPARLAIPGTEPPCPATPPCPGWWGSHQEYSRDPVVLRFADMILAVVCAVLALYFAASPSAFRHPRPRLCLFFP